MNWWSVIIIALAVGLLPWQVFRYARRRNDVRVAKSPHPSPPSQDDDSPSW